MAALALCCLAKAGWLISLGLRPRWGWALHLLGRDWRRYGTASVLQAGSYAGAQHVPVMILAGISGAAEVAGLVAMRSLTQPLQVVIRSLDAADKNKFRAQGGNTAAGARRVFWRTAGLYALIGLVAVAVLALFSTLIIHIAYGTKYSGLDGIMVSWGVYFLLLALTLPIQSVVYVADRQKAFTPWTMVSAVVGTLAASLLCPGYGAWGAMAATLVATAVNVGGGAFTIRRIIFGGGDDALPRERAVPRAMG
jgi:O-antigen/teichoic acid export membrane protein